MPKHYYDKPKGERLIPGGQVGKAATAIKSRKQRLEEAEMEAMGGSTKVRPLEVTDKRSKN